MISKYENFTNMFDVKITSIAFGKKTSPTWNTGITYKYIIFLDKDK
jgi:hypothetical protein